MRLDHLYSGGPRRVLAEEQSTPLEPSRYPPISEHVKAAFTPNIDVTSELKRLDQLARRDPASAYRAMRELIDMDLITGLKGQAEFYGRMGELEEAAGVQPPNGVGDYLVVAADLDATKHLVEKSGLGHLGVSTVMQKVGELLKKAFGRDPKVNLYHKHGDEFAVVRYIGDEDLAGVQAAFVDVLRRCIMVANALASKGFAHDGWPAERRVQPTISFGISTSDQAADSILTHLKSGDAGRRPLKYVVVIDRDLRNKLGLSVDDINRLKVQAPPEVGVVEMEPREAVFEEKSPVDEVRERPGAVIVECSFGDIPEHRRMELAAVRRQKRGYLNAPAGAMVIPTGQFRSSCFPLKEQYKFPT